MSMPKFPENTGLTREDAINQIISSIAMEELALSHILNAEGEKIQYVLGTLETQPPRPATIEEVLKTNDSVRKVIESASNSQMFLKAKMSEALAASSQTPAPASSGAIISFNSAEGITQNIMPAPDGVDIGIFGEATIVAAGKNTSPLPGVNFGHPIIFDQNSPNVASQIAAASIIIPRDGEITSFAAQMYAQSAMTGYPDVNMTMTAGIYISTDGGHTFNPALETDFAPNITNNTMIFTPFEAKSGGNAQVNKGDRIMFVVGLRSNTPTGGGHNFTTQFANFSVAIS